MFRTSKCSSSGRLVHAVFTVFLSHIHISSLVDGSIKHILPSTGQLIWMRERNNIKTACTSLPEDENLDVLCVMVVGWPCVLL